MMISNEQARQAAEDIRSQRRDRSPRCERDVSQTVIDEARLRVSQAPETRDERIRLAKQHLESGGFDPTEIAEKMLARIIGDALR